MGWGFCGKDKNGRKIGYEISAICDHDGCNKNIDRGLSYACGGMHGEDEIGCEKYFCQDHMSNVVLNGEDFHHVCDDCSKHLIESGEWLEDEVEGCIIRLID